MTAATGKLIIGLDFGTTFSGASWLYLDNGLPVRPAGVEPIIVSRWPSGSQGYRHCPKTPSKIYYDEETDQPICGYEIPNNVEPLQWFKLLLLDHEHLPDHLKISTQIKAARRIMENIGKSIVQITGDYLRYVWDHVMREIRLQEIRLQEPGYAGEETQISVFITVPTTWESYACERLKEAAEVAGITGNHHAGTISLEVVSEQDSALRAVLPDAANMMNLGVGESFILVDAGGATVDVASYQVDSLQPLVVAKRVEGDGALCGEVLLDEAFDIFVRQHIGSNLWNNVPIDTKKRWLENHWENIKSTFDGVHIGTSKGPWKFETPPGCKGRILNLRVDTIGVVFEQVFAKIHGLIEDQITAIRRETQEVPKFVVLSGGFSRSPYMRNYLNTAIRGDTAAINSSGYRPWSAICRGAVLTGGALIGVLPERVRVDIRIMRRSYGWEYSSYFIEGIHRDEDRFWDASQQCDLAKNQIQWGVNKGEYMPARQPKSYQLTKCYTESQLLYETISHTIYGYDESPLPFQVDQSVRLAGTLMCQAEAFHRAWVAVPDHPEGGYHILNYEITFQGSGADLEISLISNGALMVKGVVPM
ncbi:hypothetical protein F5B20DRAFT_580840 [Whalleya microplaca]|nr:hypothetical protein F5B20DRAFT_580840 [Whalleya microplaca]